MGPLADCKQHIHSRWNGIPVSAITASVA